MLAHAFGASQLQTPELLMTAEEATLISDAAANVAKWYDIAILDPKTMDHLRLAGVLCGVYGGKAIAVYQRRSLAQQAMQGQQQANGMMPPAGMSDAAQPVPVNVVPYGSGAVN